MQTLRATDLLEPSGLRRVGVSFLVLLASALPGCKADTPKPSPEGSAAAVAPGAAPSGAVPPAVSDAPALTIAYSDWPGWVAWDIGLKKGWFDAAGVKVDFKWFEYVPSMEAFSAGKVDAVAMTNGDQLVTGASGAPSVALLLNDYSNGNDMVVAKPGIESVAQLKGKKVGVEVGFVSHLMLLNALNVAKLSDRDIEIVNLPTDQTPQALKSGSVDAIVAWQPNSGQALREVAGSKAIFTSANLPGVIYDVLAVNPKSLAERQSDWEKVAAVWFRIVDYVKDDANRSDVLSIMSARVGLTPEQYAPLMNGTFLLDAEANAKHYRPGDNLESVFFSSQSVDRFNTEHGVYKVSQKPETYLNAALNTAVVAKAKAGAPAPK
ncbi:MAG TPA: ABC transporter substrate-binding protein [Polyangiaceae bacterium]|nr:ABC transporter substrate-binding protein [Polyangiaceae bacterium]